MTRRLPIALVALIKKAIKQETVTLIVIVASLIFMGLAQSSLLFVVGPLLKALVQMSDPDRFMAITDVLPENVLKFFHFNTSFTLSMRVIAFSLPPVLFVLGFLRSVANFLFEMNQAKLAVSVSRQIRDELFKKILHFEYEFISKRSPASWMSMIMNDVMVLQTRISEVAITFVRDSVLVSFSFLALTLISWKLALFALVLMPFLAAFMGVTGKRIARYAESWQRELARLANTVLDIRTRFEFIRVQHGEKNETFRFDQVNQQYFHNIKKSILLRSAFAPVLELVGFFVFAAAIYILVVQDQQTIIDPDRLIQFFTALGLMLRPLRNVGEQLTRFQEIRGALAQSFDVLTNAPTLSMRSQKAHTAFALETSAPLATIKHKVSREITLDMTNIYFTKGKCTAVVGPSGSGKSTLLKILAGLITPDVATPKESLWSMALASNYVSQRPFMFGDSLRLNLLYGFAQPLDDSEIMTALQVVLLRDFVQGLPQGLDTVMNQFMQNVSGGQMQRLALARSLLRPHPLLLLDEATSSVDVATERYITENVIAKVRQQGQCLYAVTHRMGMLPLYDEVIFVESGKFLLRGTPAEVMASARFIAYARTVIP